MMRRTSGSKSLKRVDGDGYLAPIQIDPNRPITAGAPLRRCSNDTSISPRHNLMWPSTPSTLSQISTIRESRESGDNESSSRLSSGYSPPFSTPSTRYAVPVNTAIESSATRSRSSVVTTKSTAEVHNAIGRTRSIRLAPEKSRFPTIKAYRATRSLHTSSTSTKNDDFPLDDYIKMNDKRSHQDSGLLSYKSYTHSGTPSTGRLETESTPVEEINLSTESSLNFPVSNENILQTRSAEWSLKSQVATAPRKTSSGVKAKPNFSAGHKIETESSENVHTENETIASSQTGEGDGDTIKTPGSEQASDQDYCLVPFIPLPGPSNLHHTPPQTSASAANKTGFSLTFRKPKYYNRPRSIVTNSSSNRGSPLSTTASTPNPMSPGKPVTPNPLPTASAKESKKKTMLLDDNGNNNNNGSVINTKNKSMNSGLSLKKAAVKDGKTAAVVLPAEITYESAAIVADEPMASEGAAMDVYDPDESFWQSDSSSSEEKPAADAKAKPGAVAAKPVGHHHPHHGHVDGHHPHHAGKEHHHRDHHPGQGHHEGHSHEGHHVGHPHEGHSHEGHSHEGHHEGHAHEGHHLEGHHVGHAHEGHHLEAHHEGHPHEEHHLAGHHEEHPHEGHHEGHHIEGQQEEHHHEGHHEEHHHEGHHEEHHHEGHHEEHHHEGHHEEHHPEEHGDHHHEEKPEHHEDQEPHPEGEKVETPPPKEEAGSENNKTEKTEEPLSIRTVSVPVSAPKRLRGSKSSSIKTYPSSSGSGYPSYPSSSGYVTGTQTTTTSSPTEADGPFLRTEKGAIRFHLPGRIQHKTTIKVAHFPTGDDKNIILNVKKDNADEEACEEMMPPNCANNQNFVVPQQYASYPPQPYNPYSMYGYGDYSPYSIADYYRYYGYPTPPYC